MQDENNALEGTDSTNGGSKSDQSGNPEPAQTDGGATATATSDSRSQSSSDESKGFGASRGGRGGDRGDRGDRPRRGRPPQRHFEDDDEDRRPRTTTPASQVKPINFDFDDPDDSAMSPEDFLKQVMEYDQTLKDFGEGEIVAGTIVGIQDNDVGNPL